MGKISTYAIDSTPQLNDKVIGTDVNDLNITKNYTIGDIISLSPSNSLLSTKMFYGDANNVPAETNTLTYHVGGLGAAATDTTQINGSIVMDATDAETSTSLVLGKGTTPLALRPGEFPNILAIGVDVAPGDMTAASVGLRDSQLIGTRIATDFVSGTNDYILYSTLIGDDMLTTQTGGGSQMSGTVAVGGRSLKSIDNSDDDVFVGFWVLGNQNNYGPNCTTARNTFVGSRIAFSHESEEMEDNVIIGYGASADAGTVVVKNLFDNVIIGSVAGRQFGGQKNIIIGSQAAWNASELQDSVILTPHSSNARPFYATAASSVLIGSGVGSGPSANDFLNDVYIGNSSGQNLNGGGHTLVGAGTFAGGGLAGFDLTSVIAVGLGAFGSAQNPGAAVSTPIAMGYLAGANAGNAGGNYSNSICIGTRAGDQMNGENNISIGNNAHGGQATLGFFNVAVGTNALNQQQGGDFNVAIGNDALFNLGTGTNNTAVGKSAGSVQVGFDNTTALGHNSQPQASNEIVLGDNNVTTLRCNTQVISGLSDLRDKNNVEDLRLGLDFISDLKPVSWDWERRDGTMEGKKDSGFIAQFTDNVLQAHSAEEILPSLVNRDNPDAWQMGNAALIPVLVKAIQELKAELDALKK